MKNVDLRTLLVYPMEDEICSARAIPVRGFARSAGETLIREKTSIMLKIILQLTLEIIKEIRQIGPASWMAIVTLSALAFATFVLAVTFV